MEYDNIVLDAFLEKQEQLFPKPVASSREEAENFLTECLAVVCDSIKDVWDYFDESGVDITGMKEEDILEADEVFEVGDGRYLIVEC